jgi:hypothetical protein
MDYSIEIIGQILLVAVILYYYFKFKNKKKRRLAEEAFQIKVHKCAQSLQNLFYCGACIDGEASVEMGAVVQPTMKLLYKTSEIGEGFGFSAETMETYEVNIDAGFDIVNKISASSDKDYATINKYLKPFVQGEIENINNIILDPLWRDDNYAPKEVVLYTLRSNILREFIRLIASDFDISDGELNYYKLLKEGLEVSDTLADEMFSEEMESNKEIILESLQKIPSITQKISDYIGEEYTDFIALSRETPEKLRERVPGLSKAAAQAIIRRLSFLSD